MLDMTEIERLAEALVQDDESVVRTGDRWDGSFLLMVQGRAWG